ncbi:MAG: helix-turn-helix domain-containing protein [Sphingobacteriales bacterium]
MKDQENIAPIEQYLIDYIVRLRTKNRMSQAGIADLLGVDKSFIGNIESKRNSAKYNLRHLNILADYFKLSPRDFLPLKPLKQKNFAKGKTSRE